MTEPDTLSVYIAPIGISALVSGCLTLLYIMRARREGRMLEAQINQLRSQVSAIQSQISTNASAQQSIPVYPQIIQPSYPTTPYPSAPYPNMATI